MKQWVPLIVLVGVVCGVLSNTSTAQTGIQSTPVNPFTQTQAAATYLTVRLSDGSGFLTPGTDYTHNAALTADSSSGPLGMLLAKDFDGAALPNVVSAEGDAVAGSASLYGVQYVMLTGEDGSLQYGTATTPLVVGDGAGAMNVICDSGCSGGTQYAEDAVHASGNTGTLALVVRNDAGTALAADGDNIPLMVNSAGSLYVVGTGTFTVSDGAGALNVIIDSSATLTVTDGAGALNVICDSGCGTQYTQDVALTVGTTVGTMAMGRASAAAPTDVNADGDAVIPWYLRSGAQATVLTAAGALVGGDATNGIDVDVTRVTGTVTIAGAVTNAGTFAVQPGAATSGGADSLKYTSAGATEDEHAVKATAGTLYSITATNTNAAARYLRCENDTAANTTPGSETVELDLAIPGATAGAGFSVTFPMGYSFSTALTCWIVTGAADTDVAEVAANEIKVFYTFK